MEQITIPTQQEIDEMKNLAKNIYSMLAGLTYDRAQKVIEFTGQLLHEAQWTETVKSNSVSPK